MRLRAIVLLSGVLVIALLLISNSAAAACGPVDFDSPPSAIWCEVRAITPVPATPTPAFELTTAPAAAVSAKAVTAANVRGGDSPADALELSSQFQMINPGGRIWYKIGADGSHMDVWLTTFGHPGVGFNIYAPNQTDLQSPDTQPKGVGTYPSNDPNTLRWSGGSWRQIGTWYALVYNNGSVAASVKLESNQSQIDKNCHSYYEDLPNGDKNVYWTACN
jgi:hypothetical protein